MKYKARITGIETTAPKQHLNIGVIQRVELRKKTIGQLGKKLSIDPNNEHLRK